MDNITIKMIADRAGVAKSTVSRVLNNNGYVSGETRKRVEAVIRELKYSPSAVARNLSRKETTAIGVIIPEADNSFFSGVLRGISQVADERGFSLIYCDTCNDPVRELRALDMLRGQRVVGLIMTPASEYSSQESAARLRRALKGMGAPAVLLDRTVENSQWDGVYFDNYNGAYLATQALIDAGHKKIGTIIGKQDLLLGRERLRGFREAMADNGLTPDAKYIYEGDFTSGKAYHITRQFIEAGDWPEAIFLSNNLTAIGFFKAIFEAGLTICRDICCIGFDYVEMLDYLIGYSYVERDTENMGRTAAEILIERINRNIIPRREFVIPARLVLNGSERFFS